MCERIVRLAQLLTLALMVAWESQPCWAGPPGPPVPPVTPVGGTEMAVATAVGIALYGIWKSRR